MEHVAARMGRQRRLVVVDNCEHLLEASGDVIEQLIGACPSVHVLATSREPVMVRGERLSAVPSLTPDDALGLFLERAAAEAPGLEVDTTQTEAAVELCERLDRLPLAIELVASRLRAQTPVELLAAIDERLRLLVGGRRSRMERHQTMRGTLDWSYDLCDPLEQEVFDRLSVFAAGFDLDDAVVVASPDSVSGGEVADAVARLVDRSLLARTQGSDGRSRFRLLETMRAYGREHLQAAGTSDDVRHRHARWVAAESIGLPEAWHGPDPTTVEARMNSLLPDVATALDWRIDRRDWHATPALCFSASLEARINLALLDRVWVAADAAGELDQLPAIVLGNAHQALSEKADFDEVTRRALANIRTGSWRVSTGAASFPPHIQLINSTLTPDEAHEVIDSLSELHDRPVYQQFLSYLSAARPLADALGSIDEVLEVLEKLDRLAHVLGGPNAIGRAHHARGIVASINGDWTGSIDHLEQALELMSPSWGATAQSGFHILLASVLTDREIQADAIRAPWQTMRDLELTIHAPNGTYCTGVALAHLGYTDLARSFFGWFRWFEAHWPFGQHHVHDAVRRQVPEATDLIEAAEPEEMSIDRIIDAGLDAADAVDVSKSPIQT